MIARSSSSTFLATAGLAGSIFGTYSVALPLYAAAIHQDTSITGLLLAIATLAVAVGSIAAGLVVRAVGATLLLVMGMAISALATAILLEGSLIALIFGSVLVGAGLGLYWAGSQALLSAQSGRPGSQQAFINQFVLYTVGTIGGSVLSGAASSLLHSTGLTTAAAARAGFAIGLIGGAVALGLNWPRRRERLRGGRVATIASGAGRDAVLQLSDLCLVSALAFILALAPVVLSVHFGLSALQVGVSYGLVSLAKMGGSFFAGRLVRRRGHRWAITLIISTGALLTLVLALVAQPILFVGVLALAALTAGGVWPVVVDATLATVRPDRRATMALTWSAREYPVIAVATLAGGWLLSTVHRLSVFYAITAALLVAAALAARMLSSAPSRAPHTVM